MMTSGQLFKKALLAAAIAGFAGLSPAVEITARQQKTHSEWKREAEAKREEIRRNEEQKKDDDYLFSLAVSEGALAVGLFACYYKRNRIDPFAAETADDIFYD